MARRRDSRTARVPYDPEFTPADEAALGGDWSCLLDVVRPAVAAGPAALIDDDLALVNPWGFDPAIVRQPVLLLHHGADRVIPCSQGEWLALRAHATLWLSPEGAHISVLSRAAAAPEWLAGAPTR